MSFTVQAIHIVPFLVGFFYAWRFDSYFLGVALMLIWAGGFMEVIAKHVTLLDAILFYVGMSLFELVNRPDFQKRWRW